MTLDPGSEREKFRSGNWYKHIPDPQHSQEVLKNKKENPLLNAYYVYLDIIAVTQTAELLLTSSVPHIESKSNKTKGSK